MAEENIHAGCVVLGKAGTTFGAPEDAGILLLGPSGSGKSDIALRLIAAGATLVSDDRTVLTADGGKLIASPPPTLAGLIEVRSVGILALPHRASAHILLAIELVTGHKLPRMPHPARYAPPPALELPEAAWPPLIRLNPCEFSATAKIVAAAAGFAHALFREEIKTI